MRPRVVIALVVLLVVVSVGSLQATAGGGERFTGTLSGFEETPTLSVPGTGTIRVELSGDGKTISYRLRYSALTGPALFAHIHLGRPAIAGGVIAFLCDSADTAPDGVTVPECPGAGGQVSGTIQASDVIGPAGQGIAAGEFDELVAALRAKATYANVHTEPSRRGRSGGASGSRSAQPRNLSRSPPRSGRAPWRTLRPGALRRHVEVERADAGNVSGSK